MSTPSAPFRPLRYAYGQLDVEERAAYRAIVEHASRFEERFVVGRLSHERTQRAYDAVRADQPLLFYLGGCKRISGLSSHPAQLEPIYLMSPAEARQTRRQIECAGDALAQATRGATDFRKERVVHDYLLSHVTYCDPGEPGAHEAWGPLVRGRGVCDGISKAFSFLCERCELPALLVTGEAEGDGFGSAPRSALGARVLCSGNEDDAAGHAWNIVYLDGIPYHLDVTFDLGVTSTITRYDYLNLSTREMSKTHRFDQTAYPYCPRRFEVYRRAGRQVADVEELTRLLVGDQRNRPGKPSVVQTKRSWGSGERIAERVAQAVHRASLVSGSHVQGLHLSMNHERNVFQIEYE